MDQIKSFLQISFYNNTMKEYFLALITFLICIVIIKLFDKFILRKLDKIVKKTKSSLDDLVVFTFKKSIPAFYSIAFYISIFTLNLTEKVKSAFIISAKIIVIIYIVYILSISIDWFVNQHLNKENITARERALKSSAKFVKFIVYIFALLLLLNNLNIKITSILTGLGIAGIAVALAVQTILSDLFSYFTIIFDKPFEEGDFIVFGDFSGTVEHIGLKSTRVRSLSGEEIVVSNAELTSTKIRNYKRMKKRRVVFSLGVTYDTPIEKLKEIPTIIENIIKNIKDATFDRAHFISFGDFSLNFEIVYYISDSDYLKYMNIQQDINFKIAEEFKKRHIEFAFPTQVIYINK